MTHAQAQDSDALARFRALADEYVALLATQGVRKRPYRSRDLADFSKLSQSEKQEAIASLEAMLAVYRDILSVEGTLRDTPKTIWRGLSRLGLTPRSDVFDHYQDRDVVMVYSLEQKPLLWNLRIEELLNFTVEEMFAKPWHKLTRRDPKIEYGLYAAAVKMISGEEQGTVHPGVEAHEIEEIDTPEKDVYRLEFGVISPIKRGDALAAILVIHRAERAPRG